MTTDSRTESRQTAMWRMVGMAHPPDPSRMTPARALRIAVPKAADAMLGLAASLLDVKEEKRALEPFLESLTEDSRGEDETGPLLMVFEREDGARAVAIPDAQLLATLIEVQTTGRVLTKPAVQRPPTATDAVMCSGFTNRLLADFAGELFNQPAAQWATGYRYWRKADNPRLLALMLEDLPYRVFHLLIDLDGGSRQGRLSLAFPVRAVATRPAANIEATWQQAMESRIMESRTDLEAILYRLRMPLAEARKLAVGDMLRVPLTAVTDVSLEDIRQRKLARVHLGQQNGMRAVRLRHDGAVEGLPATGLDTMADGALPAAMPGVGATAEAADAIDPASDLGDSGPTPSPSAPSFAQVSPDSADLPMSGAFDAVDGSGPGGALDDDGGLPDLPPLPMGGEIA